MKYGISRTSVSLFVLVGVFSTPTLAQQITLEELREQVERVRAENQELKEKVDSIAPAQDEDGITVGGAVRFQYVYEDYNTGQKDRGGDLDFDIFRIDLNGKMGDVILSAQYRWFEYMDAFRHAYFGYNFTDEWQGQVGIVIQPFGNMPYNSHNYFFSSNFYLGLEDNNGAGVRFTKRTDVWDLDFAFILNDELGGVDGATVSKTDRYNYDVVGIRLPGEGAIDKTPTEVAAENTPVVMSSGCGAEWTLRRKDP